MTDHRPAYFEARNVYQRLADMLALVDKLSFLAEHGEVVNMGRVVRDALAEMYRFQNATGWQTIDTAPKVDGRPLLFLLRSEPVLGYWGQSYYAREPLTWCAYKTDDHGVRRAWPVTPTHWLELPEPPK